MSAPDHTPVVFTRDEAYEIARMLQRTPPGLDGRPIAARKMVLTRAANAPEEPSR